MWAQTSPCELQQQQRQAVRLHTTPPWHTPAVYCAPATLAGAGSPHARAVGGVVWLAVCGWVGHVSIVLCRFVQAAAYPYPLIGSYT